MIRSHIKGAVAELEIQTAAAKLGVPVLKPVVEQSRCDLAFDIAGRIWRVQCKWGRLSQSGDVIIVRIGGCWCSPNRYVRTTYAEHEVDLFGVYCGELDRCFLLPVSLVAGMSEVRLRLAPTRNGQRVCINLAEDFDFEGAIAQLGERVNGIHEVAGSSPASSTPPATARPGSDCLPVTIGSETLRDRLGYWMARVAAGEEALVTFRGKPHIRLSPAAPQPRRDPPYGAVTP